MYASIEQEAQPVALGMSAAEGDRAGFFEVLVAERLRHRGLGRQIMETLMAWARDDAGVKTVRSLAEIGKALKEVTGW